MTGYHGLGKSHADYQFLRKLDMLFGYAKWKFYAISTQQFFNVYSISSKTFCFSGALRTGTTIFAKLDVRLLNFRCSVD